MSPLPALAKRPGVVLEQIKREVAQALNRASRENVSNTPDFILACFMVACLDAFEQATNDRGQWFAPAKAAESEDAHHQKPGTGQGHESAGDKSAGPAGGPVAHPTNTPTMAEWGEVWREAYALEAVIGSFLNTAHDHRVTAALHDALLAASGATVGAELEMDLRREWWLNHGHDGLYGDDGEMQCSRCGPVWDYKRAPMDEIRAAVALARLQRVASTFGELEVRAANEAAGFPTGGSNGNA